MKLRYNESHQFYIMQVTDTHLGSYPFQENDKKTLHKLQKAVEGLKPDLIVFTGDIIYSLKEHFAENPLKSFEAFIHFVNRFEIPYVVTFGNHDAEPESGIGRAQLRQIYQEKCLYKPLIMDEHLFEERYSYLVPIYDTTGQTINQMCFVIDSGDYSGTDHSYYAWVAPEQIDWFKEAVQKYSTPDKKYQHLMFQHIPIPEYWLASLDIQSGEFSEDIGENLSWSTGQTATIPFKNFVASPEVNSGLFYQMLMSQSIWGMFVGHDHDNNFDGVYKNIHLIYGQSSGYNTYGTLSKGVRMIYLNEIDGCIETQTVQYDC
ncbi:metallophosphoesterase [Streptococcus merionis]|uniref:metallophosphoesterase n=1 Tax=Streptococcus merionis TaxID=400065 RepID=UPI0026E96F32|nr:metallophosphoesterase [Streptococcus merionis]